MPLYEYKCPQCGETKVQEKAVEHRNQLPACHHGQLAYKMKRKYSFSAHLFDAGYNASLGVEVSSQRQLESEARRLSDLHSERTGYPANFVPVDLSDTKALGVDGAGAESTMKHQTDTGQREAKLYL